MKMELYRIMAIEIPFTEEEMKSLKPAQQAEKIFEKSPDQFQTENRKNGRNYPTRNQTGV